MKLPDRLPDYQHENLSLWFEEMVCETRVTERGDFYKCYMVLGVKGKQLGFQIPKDANIISFMAALSGITAGAVVFFTDDISEAYWKYRAGQILIEEAYGSHQCEENV